jgi:hypothetical protein
VGMDLGIEGVVHPGRELGSSKVFARKSGGREMGAHRKMVKVSGW